VDLDQRIITHNNRDITNIPSVEIYYIGIIDILTNFSSKKKFESFFRGMTQKKSIISAVNPLFYGIRFLNFMKNAINAYDSEQEAKNKNDNCEEVSKILNGQIV
jgi:hypothetical protein